MPVVVKGDWVRRTTYDISWMAILRITSFDKFVVDVLIAYVCMCRIS